MKINHLKEKIIYLFAIALSVFLLLIFIMCTWIGYEVKDLCYEAKGQYGGDCVESLQAQLNDEKQGFGARNSAIWALGQLGDTRALATLESYYTGIIPDREPLNVTISQYELKKAIKLSSGANNVAALFWRNLF